MNDAGSRPGRAALDRAAAGMLNATVLQRLAIATAATALALLIGLVVVAAAGYDPLQFVRQLIEGRSGTATPSLGR